MKRSYFIPTIFSFILFIISTGCQNNKDIYINDSKNFIKPIIPPNYSYATNNQNKKTTYNNQRSYCVFGKCYNPIKTYKNQKFYGVASWYGPKFHGKLTANGEIYDMYKYTAAHKILPIGTKVKVTNLNNNKSVIVRINDRGPFVKERIIDLSYVAAKQIGIDKTGTAPVKLLVLSTPNPIPYKKIANTNKKTNNKSVKTIKNNTIKIQIGAFSLIKGAKIIKEKYKTYNAYIEKKQNLYKVYVGNFSTKEEALKFKNKFKLNGFIVRN
jgi:rare lipoprotein A